MTAPWLQDSCSLAEAIRRGEIRSADALEGSLAAIAASKLNAVVYLDAQGARSQAAEIDRQVAAGEDPGPFAGVPLLVKDMAHAKGMTTTYGAVPYKNRRETRTRCTPGMPSCTRRPKEVGARPVHGWLREALSV